MQWCINSLIIILLFPTNGSKQYTERKIKNILTIIFFESLANKICYVIVKTVTFVYKCKFYWGNQLMKQFRFNNIL